MGMYLLTPCRYVPRGILRETDSGLLEGAMAGSVLLGKVASYCEYIAAWSCGVFLAAGRVVCFWIVRG